MHLRIQDTTPYHTTTAPHALCPCFPNRKDTSINTQDPHHISALLRSPPVIQHVLVSSLLQQKEKRKEGTNIMPTTPQHHPCPSHPTPKRPGNMLHKQCHHQHQHHATPSSPPPTAPSHTPSRRGKAPGIGEHMTYPARCAIHLLRCQPATLLHGSDQLP